MKTTMRGALVGAIITALALSGATAAQAEDAEGLDAVAAVAGEAGIDLATVVDGVGAGQTFGAALADVSLPATGADPLTIEGASGQAMALDLPTPDAIAPTNDATAELPAGVPVYSGGSTVDLMPLVHDDGTVTLAATVGSPTAGGLDFGLTVPEGATVTLSDSGGVQVLDVGGGFMSGVTPPIAVDAHGDTVPSELVVTDGGFEQIIDAGDVDAYPVVVQMRAGSALINRFVWTGNDIAVHVTPLVAVADSLTAAVPGWQQLLDLQTSQARRNTLKGNGTYNQQWQCHAAGKAIIGIAGFTGLDPRPAWGLEGSRGKRADYVAFPIHQCNW